MLLPSQGCCLGAEALDSGSSLRVQPEKKWAKSVTAEILIGAQKPDGALL